MGFEGVVCIFFACLDFCTVRRERGNGGEWGEGGDGGGLSRAAAASGLGVFDNLETIQKVRKGLRLVDYLMLKF